MSHPIINAQLVNCNENVAQLILQLLSHCQHCSVNLTIDHDNNDAKQHMRSQPFDIVFVGSATTTETGLDYLHWIRNICQDDNNMSRPTIIALSAQHSAAIYEQLLHAGASDILAIDQLNTVVLEQTILQTMRQRADEKRLLSTIFYDPLTGLANRTLFHSQLNSYIAQAKRSNQRLALMLITFDHYQTIVDTAGFDAGDELLSQAASRLYNCIRETDMVARLNNNEFVLVANQLGDYNDAATLANDLLRACKIPVSSELDDILVTCSIGLAMFPEDGHTIHQLLQQADRALNESINHGGNCFNYADKRLNQRSRERQQLSADIGHALLREQLQLYLQPVISTNDYSISAVEVLLRWQHPSRGLLTPKHFLASAQSSGLINPIGSWVLRSACEHHLQWLSQGLPPIPVAINVSSEQLQQPSLLNTVKSLSQKTGFDIKYLTMELSEREIYQCDSDANDILYELHDMGVHITVDNFGKDYCSLSKLQELPIDTIKIDRSLIQQLQHTKHNVCVIDTIIQLAKSMRLDVIAQGIEDRASIHILEQKHCHKLQGFGIAKPLSADDFPQWYNHFSNGQPLPAMH